MMLGYAHGNHLMARTTPHLMLWTMMMIAMSEAEVLTSDDEAKDSDSARRRTSSARDQREPQPKP
jgi:hypothetical protein